MNAQQFPAGWDAERVRKLIAHQEALTEDEQVAEDEAGVAEHDGLSVISVPTAMLPAIRQLLATHKSA